MRSYRSLTDLEQMNMLNYYKTHTLDQTAVMFRITDRTGLAQFLSNNAKKTSHGGARHKADATEFAKLKADIIDKLGKAGPAMVARLLFLHEKEIG